MASADLRSLDDDVSLPFGANDENKKLHIAVCGRERTCDWWLMRFNFVYLLFQQILVQI